MTTTKSIHLFLFMIVASGVFLSCKNENKEVYTITYKSYLPLEDKKKIYEIVNSITELFTGTEERYYEGLKSFHSNGKMGFIDSLGNVVIKPKFDNVGCFNEGFASVGIGNKMGFIDKTGKQICELKYDFCNFFENGLAEVYRDGKWGYIDYTGKEVIAVQYDNMLEPFYDVKYFRFIANLSW